MEPKKLIISVSILLVIVFGFPILYTNWPRDPNPEADAPVLAQFNQAIADYKKDMGILPERLDQLTPSYMSKIPLASNREPFVYDPATGAVTPPYPLTSEKVKFFENVGSGIGTSGPMGEVMTGISIRDELSY